MKQAIKKILPGSFINFCRKQKVRLNIARDYIYDYRKYVSKSASLELRNRENLAAFLIKEYHAVEKGLALNKPRLGFGIERINKLIDVLNEYLSKYGTDQTTDITVSSLVEYAEFDSRNNKNPNPVIPRITDTVNEYRWQAARTRIGGTKEIKKADILATLNFDYSSFVKSRFSTRDFDTRRVDRDILIDAIDIARFTPSVCNRQAWKVYIVDHNNPELKRKYLNVQNGNKGFGDNINSLLIITGKLSSFFSFERNQVFIDGGMFAMSVVLALHSKGLGVCCLNTSYTSAQHENFKKVMGLDEDAVPIMFLAVGHLKEAYRVAVSTRKPVGEIVSFY